MKIGETYSHLSSGSVQGRASTRGRELRQSSPENSIHGDSLGGVVMKAAEDRASRLEQIQRAIQDGTYKVDTRDLSSKIIERHLDR